ncbi:MAG: AI-2E family transporter, partial [Deltaproteobacteria bacterium]|nr:AI-2E family transporter [Deltaproteobacteria bacterium]
MNARTQAWFWLLVLAAALLLIWLLSAVLLPFVLGIALAYSLDPAATRLERRGCSRMAATVLIGAGFF